MNEKYVEVVKRIRYYVNERSGEPYVQVFDGNTMVYEDYAATSEIAEGLAKEWIDKNYCLYYPPEEVSIPDMPDPLAPREMTEDEVRERVYDHFNVLIDYWFKTGQGKRDALDGIVFSIMSTIDGCAGDMPRFIFAPDPHPEDKDFHKAQGEDWYPENHQNEDINCDLAGSLHELWYSYKENK
jgi:hypothetical protein